jgi:UDP-N-acetylglucosamine 2-epimerase (non-hydrolysing)
MSSMIKIGIAVGTRPEAIKISPLILELKERGIHCDLIMSGQHVGLVIDVLETFGIKPHINLSIINKDGDLGSYFSELLSGFSKYLGENNYDLFLVHGDTLTAAAAALACYLRQVKVGHIESGLRTNNIFNPFPEEGNREIIDLLSTFKFAPTQLAYSNLVNKDFSVVTGNTGIDAVRAMYDVFRNSESNLKSFLQDEYRLEERNYILVTLHRRESFGTYHQRILESLKKISAKIEVVYILHPNPGIKNLALSQLSNNSRIKLLDSQSYAKFFYLMLGARAIVTDSGGIQEEAFALGIPLFVARENTERPEILASSLNHIVGDDQANLMDLLDKLLENRFEESRSFQVTEIGDGLASVRIANFILQNIP